MVCVLEVAPPEGASLGAGKRHVFSTQGGTIGRAGSNDWVLSHRKVSGRHAQITYHDGVFYIVDETSANGVFLNSSRNRLVPGKRYALKSGDRIIIDPYQIDVAIQTAEDGQAAEGFEPLVDHRAYRPSPAPGYDPFDAGDPFAPPRRRTPEPIVPSTPPAGTPAGEPVPLEELDPLRLLGGAPTPAPPRPAPSAASLASSSPLLDHYQPPGVQSPPPELPRGGDVLIPPDYDPLRDDFLEPFPAAPAPPVPEPPAPPVRTPPPAPPPPARQTRPAAAAPVVPVRETPAPTGPDRGPDQGLLEVLKAAGLESAPVTLEFARNLGQIFRVVVSGVMDVLRSRQQIKDEFRMRLTQFRPADNNPLKFSANVDDALHNLLVKRNAAYLEPIEAFEDAFEDLRNHQIAMLAGMRVAFEAMLNQFHPDRLQEEFDRQLKRSSLLGVTARLRYWEVYRERYEGMARDPEATFRRLFGEEFARAYEEQLNRLKAERRPSDGGDPRSPLG